MKIDKEHVDSNWFEFELRYRFSKAHWFYGQVRQGGLRWLSTHYCLGEQKDRSTSRFIDPVQEFSRINSTIRQVQLSYTGLFLILLVNLVCMFIAFGSASSFDTSCAWLVVDLVFSMILLICLSHFLSVLSRAFIESKWTTANFQLQVIKLAHIFGGTYENLAVLMGNGVENLNDSVPKHVIDRCTSYVRIRIDIIVEANYWLRRQTLNMACPPGTKFRTTREIEELKAELKEDFALFEQLTILPFDYSLRRRYQDAEAEIPRAMIQRLAEAGICDERP